MRWASTQPLPLEQLEALADALLDFQGPADLAAGARLRSWHRATVVAKADRV